MHNYPNPNDPYIAAILLGLVVLLALFAIFWIEDKLTQMREREQQRIDEIAEEVKHAIDDVGSEAYVHPDRYVVHTNEDGTTIRRGDLTRELNFMYALRDKPPVTDADLDRYIAWLCEIRGVTEKDDEGRRGVLLQLHQWLA